MCSATWWVEFSPTIEIICLVQVGKGHCKLLHDGETLIEYDDWWDRISLVGPTNMIVMIFIRYDYSTSYPDGEAADKDEEVFLG